mgnify:CR=1 FL=1
MASINLQGDTSGAITISAPSVAGSNTLTLPATTQTLATQNALGVRNRIINGDMRIDQRNAGASVTGNNATYGIDRWKTGATQSSKFTMQQVTDAPENFTHSLKITSSSSYTLTSSDEFEMIHFIEGNNVADLGWGTSSAKTITMSFYVKSSLTGTFGGVLYNSASNRSYTYSYTINTANTWEQKTITIAGDTAGTWTTDNTVGIGVLFCIGAGSSLLSTPGSWDSTFYRGPTGQVSVVSTNAATWQITGLQLEVGDTATPFEHRPYDMELQRCQRYYLHKNFIVTTSNYWQSIDFPVEMRSHPSQDSLTFEAGSGATIASLAGATVDKRPLSIYQNNANSALAVASVRLNAEL